MKKLLLLSICSLALTFYSCSESTSVSTINMVYTETQCADAWGTGSSSSKEEVISSVIAFFDQKSIELTDVSISDFTNEATCLACTCPSTRIISVTVDESHRDFMESQEFRE